MRLLTHNMLKSHVKGVKNGYPLAIEVQMLFLTHNHKENEDSDMTFDIHVESKLCRGLL